MKTVIGVMARAPSAPGKTRLAPHLPETRLRAFRTALLADTLATVCAYPHAEVVAFVTPDDAAGEILAAAPRPVPVVAQPDGDLGARMRAALAHLFDERGCASAMLVGIDAPLVTAEHLDEAATLLRTRGGMVLGPADDGGYYLIGMTRLFAPVFEGIEWGGDAVLMDTMAAADRLRVDACLIRGAYDVDTIDDLRRLERDLAVEPAEVAPHVRRWFSARS